MAHEVNNRRVRDASAAVLRTGLRTVVRNPRVLGGEPCFRGTRVPVYMIAGLAARVGVRETHETYPAISIEQIEFAIAYAAAKPRFKPPRYTTFPTQKGKTRFVETRRIVSA